MKYTSSRLSSGNKFFPTEVHIEDSGIKIIEPGIYNSKSTYIAFHDIVSTSINNPLVGFSTLTFFSNSTSMVVNGLTKNQTGEINSFILAKKP